MIFNNNNNQKKKKNKKKKNSSKKNVRVKINSLNVIDRIYPQVLEIINNETLMVHPKNQLYVIQ